MGEEEVEEIEDDEEEERRDQEKEGEGDYEDENDCLQQRESPFDNDIDIGSL